jgi:hypothetical protein
VPCPSLIGGINNCHSSIAAVVLIFAVSPLFQAPGVRAHIDKEGEAFEKYPNCCRFHGSWCVEMSKPVNAAVAY